ncbi:MAG: zf-TFIIB domain-containing protein [Pseudomonadota bacterium]|uniref:TFIIB-type zinc ribbon-containing protein n=1 Tax=Herminiimonas arsenitoxidans TaxID=1809410 RepID=UPI000970694B|nr:zf-TFIIB domain-containing protein [Herminiimonas arsenitoxidans]
MKCPACNEMHLITSDRHGIEIDYCPNCRGVWLDRGELDKLIDRSANAMPPEAPPPLPRYRGERSTPVRTTQHGYNKEGYGQKNKKDLIGELFDF